MNFSREQLALIQSALVTTSVTITNNINRGLGNLYSSVEAKKRESAACLKLGHEIQSYLISDNPESLVQITSSEPGTEKMAARPVVFHCLNSSSMIEYKHNDALSWCIRKLDNSEAHMFVCHPDNECPDGCDTAGNPLRIQLYEKAFEEETILTKAFLDKLRSTKSGKEWSALCQPMLAENGGDYPAGWFEKVMASGLMAEAEKNWT
jgi:hypothetical protein